MSLYSVVEAGLQTLPDVPHGIRLSPFENYYSSPCKFNLFLLEEGTDLRVKIHSPHLGPIENERLNSETWQPKCHLIAAKDNP